ncbi:unnamed protein product [Owenia fusiformis]|uniref:Uncharacterized protein n=1 Tax=Owenia fusiformis TaxID=6347 RepID=A0A8S4NZT1_OWEFU|nr:unnamed protein product [Owenia fusiformis]
MYFQIKVVTIGTLILASLLTGSNACGSYCYADLTIRSACEEFSFDIYSMVICICKQCPGVPGKRKARKSTHTIDIKLDDDAEGAMDDASENWTDYDIRDTKEVSVTSEDRELSPLTMLLLRKLLGSSRR